MVLFAGLHFKNPYVVASSPLTARVKWLRAAAEAGAAAVSTKLTFLKQPFYGQLRMYNNPREGSIVCHDRRLDLEEGVRLVEEGKRYTGDLIYFCNITHSSDDLEGWAHIARSLENAGADIIEANFICPNLSLTARSLGQEGPSGGAVPGQNPTLAEEITRALKESVNIPVVCKLTPNVTSLVDVALACEAGGADGICVAGAQLSLPPMDIYHPERVYPLLEGASMGSLGGPAARLMGFAMVAQLARRCRVPIIGGGGIETWEHAVQYMMWGATLFTVCTALMWYGWETIPELLQGIQRFMAAEGYENYEALIGCSLGQFRAAEALRPLAGTPVVDADLCIGCGTCLKPGHCDAITLVNDVAQIDAAACLGCGICAALCPVKAITIED
ncbi:MAG: 4Fe-4S binding protein [Chloroflexi bacterium]|nr:4Fe-4S binding protein [Chloroflexota bacterium]